MSKEQTVKYYVPDWIENHKKYFAPPVCNYMMHRDGHLKVFFVGGPNIREDYHIEEGEELFYQLKGDMILKIVERGIFKDVKIKKGQCFLLPARIPHSPQRFKDTIGLVIERERIPNKEFDCLRYYVSEGNSEVLFERWFYCSDLGTQLPPVINAFMASEEKKTRKPGPASRLCPPKFEVDSERQVAEPVDMESILNNSRLSKTGGQIDIFGKSHPSEVFMLGEGTHGPFKAEGSGEMFLWQLRKKSALDVSGEKDTLCEEETLLVKKSSTLSVTNCPGGRTLFVRMNISQRSDA